MLTVSADNYTVTYWCIKRHSNAAATFGEFEVQDKSRTKDSELQSYKGL